MTEQSTGSLQHAHRGPAGNFALRSADQGSGLGAMRRLVPATPRAVLLSERNVPDWAVVSAGLSPMLLTVAWLVADMVQPAGYDPVRQTVSVLAGQAGTDRWIMTSALFFVGACYLLTAAGLAGLRPSARFLLIVAGMCSVGIATSPEPASGPTVMHMAWAAVGAVTIAVWPAFAGRPESGQPPVLSARGSALVTTLFIALLGWVVSETQGGSVLGLAERLTGSVQTTWPLVVAVALRRAARTDTGNGDARTGLAGRRARAGGRGR